MRLKCTRDVDANAGDDASLSHASFTSAVGLSVSPGSPRRTLDARRSQLGVRQKRTARRARAGRPRVHRQCAPRPGVPAVSRAAP